MFNGQKIRVAVVILIAIICCAVVFFTNKNRIMKMPMVLGTIGQNKIGESSEPSSEAFSLSSNDTVGASIDTSKWDLNRVNIVYDTENTPVPVPKGFTASGAEGEHTVNTGFVIYEGEEEVNDENAWDESCTRNQFVWVPIPDSSRLYEEIESTGIRKAKLWEYTTTGRKAIANDDTNSRNEPGILNSVNYDNKSLFLKYGMQGYDKEVFYKELVSFFNYDIESIKKYGGFYIGRYETGNVYNNNPVVNRINTQISEIGWYNMYKKMKHISDNKNIETNMIWGSLYDETLQWLIDTEGNTYEEIINSRNYGNYKNVEFDYAISKLKNTTTKRSGTVTKIPTGSTERNKTNNIYDLAGNVWEWTLEGNGSTGRYLRGGSCYDTENGMSIRYLHWKNFINEEDKSCGFRSQLIIK